MGRAEGEAEAGTDGQSRPEPAAQRSRAIRESFAYCRVVTQQRARNFYYGLKLMPEPKRSAMFALYAVMRCCDDLADEAEAEPETALANIERFRGQLVQAREAGSRGDLPSGPVWPAFAQVLEQYPIDLAHLHAMLDGQRQDVQGQSFASFDELHTYCYRVASTVGLLCVSIWGHDGQADTLQLAEHRGIALQLTNILRDLREDARRGRVYLPADELERFGYPPAKLLALEANTNFDRLMQYQIERARHYYQLAGPLEQRLSPECRPTSWAMMRIYRRLLERIAAAPRQVLVKRTRLSKLEKLMIGFSASWRKRGRQG